MKIWKFLLFWYFLTTGFDFRKKQARWCFQTILPCYEAKPKKIGLKFKKEIDFENLAKNTKNLNNSLKYKKITGANMS